MNDAFFSIERLRETPAYSPAEAAHYLRLPLSTLRAWCLGQGGGQKRSRFEPVIEIADPKRRSLSFVNLVEAHVLAGLRRELHVPLPKIREAVAYLRAELNSQRPLAEQQFVTDGVDLLIEHFGKLFNVNRRQFELREVMEAYLKRVERDDRGLPVKLFLLTRQQAPTEQPAHVVVDPRIAFGRPVLAGTGVPTAVLAERFKAGEDAQALADDYGVDAQAIAEAIRCEIELKAA